VVKEHCMPAGFDCARHQAPDMYLHESQVSAVHAKLSRRQADRALLPWQVRGSLSRLDEGQGKQTQNKEAVST